MTPFLAFFALAALALAVDRVTETPPRRRCAGRRGRPCSSSSFSISLWRQSRSAAPFIAIHAEVTQLRAFVDGLEGALRPGAMVLQVPVRADMRRP
jgi:hypothetical protein